MSTRRKVAGSLALIGLLLLVAMWLIELPDEARLGLSQVEQGTRVTPAPYVTRDHTLMTEWVDVMGLHHRVSVERLPGESIEDGLRRTLKATRAMLARFPPAADR